MKLVDNSDLPINPVVLPTLEELQPKLRSENESERRAALEALFPDESVVLLRLAPGASQVSSTRIDAPKMFGLSLFASQAIGRMLGLKLDWVQDPAQAQNTLVVPPPGAFVP